MFERVCLIHYHEIGLKGRNRTAFERRLQDNLDAALVGLPVGRVQRVASRLIVRVEDPSAVGAVAQRIAAVPGVGSVALAFLTAQDPAQMERGRARSPSREAGAYETFEVDAHRSNTDYAESSMEMNRRIGAGPRDSDRGQSRPRAIPM